MHSMATTDPKSYNEHRRIRLSLKAEMLQTQNTENIACKTVEVWPILLLAPPPSKWVAFLEVFVLDLEILFKLIDNFRINR